MTQRSTPSFQPHSFSPVRSLFPFSPFSKATRGLLTAGFAAAMLLAPAAAARAQDAAPAPAAAPDASAQTAAPDAAAAAKPSVAVAKQKTRKKDEKVVAAKDSRKEEKKTKKGNQLEGIDVKLPDKQLYDKAEDATKHGRYDVSRLLLQDLLNTYPESQFQMRAKLAIADSWYKEGGTAALTQAEQEYKDFITFFPNAPEAAEAQMRVGDIYFRQMDKPDRDDVNTLKAEAEYRLMLQQFPDSPLVPQAQQRLREVQETLADRQASVASFYLSRSNMSAAVARYQTVVDTYPLYSHMDDVLIALGDAYEVQARYMRTLKLPEAARARLEALYDNQAYAAYSKVILEHSAAPHVEDARDRIAAMNMPVPRPTPEQVAASAALENSRGQYTLSKRVTLLFLHQADTVPAATVGAPPLDDAKPTLAPNIVHQSVTDYNAALNPAPEPRNGSLPVPVADAAAPAAAPSAPAAPLAFEDVPAAGAAPAGSSATVTSVPETTPGRGSAGAAMGIEIVQPSAADAATPATAPPTPPSFPGAAVAPAAVAPAAAAGDPTGGIAPVGPPNATPLSPIEKAATAPDAVNEVTPGSQPAAQTASVDGKKPKSDYEKSSESSSKHKPKKGLKKIIPF